MKAKSSILSEHLSAPRIPPHPRKRFLYPAYSVAAPAPHLTLGVRGDRVQIRWRRGAMDAVEIQVDRGGGAGFVLLAVEAQPSFVDPTPLPDTTAIWRYRAAYRLRDGGSGQWSDPEEILIYA